MRIHIIIATTLLFASCGGGAGGTASQNRVALAVHVASGINQAPAAAAEVLASFDLTPAGYDSLLFEIALSPLASAEYEAAWRARVTP